MSELWFRQALLAQGWAQNVNVTIADGSIQAIAIGVPRAPGQADNGVALPGLPNLHSHASQRAMAGLAEVRGPSGDSFWTWRDLMYRFVDRLSPEALEAVAAMAYAEMLEGGFTRVGEFHYLHHQTDGSPYADRGEMAARLASAAQATGIALTLLPVFYAHSGFGGQAPKKAQRRFIHDLDGFARLMERSQAAVALLEDGVLGLAAHSLRAVTPEELAVIVARAPTGPIHIHIAEQTKEVEDCLAWSGQRPVEWLLVNAPVDARWCLVHATHVTAQERAGMAARGAVAGLCPITEANLGDGLFDAETFLSEGGFLGVGSDSNVLIDAAEELRLLEYGRRLVTRSRNVLASAPGRSSGGDLFRQALSGGSRALGAPADLAAGNSADIVTLRLDHPSLIGRSEDALLDGWIFAGHRMIDRVWRRGQLVVSDGRHVRRPTIEARYAKHLRDLLA